jgi:hypothetical protein
MMIKRRESVKVQGNVILSREFVKKERNTITEIRLTLWVILYVACSLIGSSFDCRWYRSSYFLSHPIEEIDSCVQLEQVIDSPIVRV